MKNITYKRSFLSASAVAVLAIVQIILLRYSMLALENAVQAISVAAAVIIALYKRLDLKNLLFGGLITGAAFAVFKYVCNFLLLKLFDVILSAVSPADIGMAANVIIGVLSELIAITVPLILAAAIGLKFLKIKFRSNLFKSLAVSFSVFAAVCTVSAVSSALLLGADIGSPDRILGFLDMMTPFGRTIIFTAVDKAASVVFAYVFMFLIFGVNLKRYHPNSDTV